MDEKEQEQGGSIVVNTIKAKPFTCVIDVPEVLSARQLIAWFEGEAPAELKERSNAFADAYERLALVDRFEVNGKVITQANFEEAIKHPNFPAQPIYAMVEATIAPINRAINKKK